MAQVAGAVETLVKWDLWTQKFAEPPPPPPALEAQVLHRCRARVWAM
jgi:hypothetical protein